MFKPFFCSFLFLFTLLQVNGADVLINKDAILLDWGIETIGTPLQDFKKHNNDFEVIFPGKSDKQLYLNKLQTKELWETIFVFIEKQKVEVITCSATYDGMKAPNICKNVILSLIDKLGNNVIYEYAKLDSIVSEKDNGYVMMWKKNSVIIAFKFGPLDKNAKKFQIQITFSSTNCQKDFLNLRKKSSSDLVRNIPQEISEFLDIDLLSLTKIKK